MVFLGAEKKSRGGDACAFLVFFGERRKGSCSVVLRVILLFVAFWDRSLLYSACFFMVVVFECSSCEDGGVYVVEWVFFLCLRIWKLCAFLGLMIFM